MPLPPLIFLVLDDIAVRQKHSPARGGVLLGLLVAAQLLTSLEVLAMTLLLAVVGLAILALRHRELLAARVRRVATALAFAVLVAGVLCAVPVAILLFGPDRYHGSVFPDTEGLVAVLRNVLWPVAGRSHLPEDANSYIGLPLIALIAVGCWRCRDGALRFAGAMAIVALTLSLGRYAHLSVGVNTHIPMPDLVLAKIPELDNLLPIRFSAFVAFFAAIACWPWRSTGSGAASSTGRGARATAEPSRGRSVAAVAIGVAAIASPMLGAPLPFAVAHAPIALCTARTRSPTSRRLVLLTYPVPERLLRRRAALAGRDGHPLRTGGRLRLIPGPGPHPLGSLPTDLPVTNAFGLAQLGLLPALPPPHEVAAMRSELEACGVTDIVLARSDADGAARRPHDARDRPPARPDRQGVGMARARRRPSRSPLGLVPPSRRPDVGDGLLSLRRSPREPSVCRPRPARAGRPCPIR